MNILILNWRDIRNPRSGGAEILTHEMAKRWTKKGHRVTQLSSRFHGSLKEEVLDGVEMIRMGTWWSVHALAFFYYLTNLKGKVDVVIDEVHWFPFFSALYARKKTVLLACEVADNLFFKLFPYPLALIGRALEKFYLIFYRDIPVLAISPSTGKALIAEGFKEKDITILPMGITLPGKLSKLKKEKNPTLIFVGRISKIKGVEDAIKACLRLKEEFFNIKLWILGKGEEIYEKEVKRQVEYLGLNEQVKFLGFVNEVKKFEMMQRAHVLIVPSIKEGYGLTVPEAGIVGTPSVVYNVEGLRDIVKDGVNGFVVKSNSDAIVDGIRKMLTQQKFYVNMRKEAIIYAKKLNWNETANKALEVMRMKLLKK